LDQERQIYEESRTEFGSLLKENMALNKNNAQLQKEMSDASQSYDKDVMELKS